MKPLLLLACAVVLVLSGCGEPRRFGDTGGVPVTVSAQVNRAFFSSMENRQGRPSAGAGVGFSSGGHSSMGVGIGFQFSSTQVYLLGGDAVGQANVFRQELKWGDNTFTVPLAAGRTIFLTIQAEGGRRGWESIGQFVIPAQDPKITLELDGNGAKVTVTPAVVQPAPAGQAPAATQPTPAPPAAETVPVKPTADTTPAPATAAPAAQP